MKYSVTIRKYVVHFVWLKCHLSHFLEMKFDWQPCMKVFRGKFHLTKQTICESFLLSDIIYGTLFLFLLLLLIILKRGRANISFYILGDQSVEFKIQFRPSDFSYFLSKKWQSMRKCGDRPTCSTLFPLSLWYFVYHSHPALLYSRDHFRCLFICSSWQHH